MTDTMLEKVRKLLAKAEDPGCTAEEATALNDKAAALIAKYGVDSALLAARSPETDPVGDRVVAVIAPYALDKAGLLGTIASALRCRSVRRKEWVNGSSAYAIHLFGFASDLERTELLYTSLLVQASYGLAAAPVPSWEAPAAFRRSWLLGFTQAVGKRLREAERRASSVASAASAGTGPRWRWCSPTAVKGSTAGWRMSIRGWVRRVRDDCWAAVRWAATRPASGPISAAPASHAMRPAVWPAADFTRHRCKR